MNCFQFAAKFLFIYLSIYLFIYFLYYNIIITSFSQLAELLWY